MVELYFLSLSCLPSFLSSRLPILVTIFCFRSELPHNFFSAFLEGAKHPLFWAGGWLLTHKRGCYFGITTPLVGTAHDSGLWFSLWLLGVLVLPHR